MGPIGERGGQPGQAARPPFLLPLPLLPSPSLPLGGILLGLGVLVGLPSLGAPPRAGRLIRLQRIYNL